MPNQQIVSPNRVSAEGNRLHDKSAVHAVQEFVLRCRIPQLYAVQTAGRIPIFNRNEAKRVVTSLVPQHPADCSHGRADSRHRKLRAHFRRRGLPDGQRILPVRPGGTGLAEAGKPGVVVRRTTLPSVRSDLLVLGIKLLTKTRQSVIDII